MCSCFVLTFNYDFTNIFFSKANEYDTKYNKTLLKQISRWLIASYNHTHQVSETLRSCGHDLDNVAVIALPAVIPKTAKKVKSTCIKYTV